MKLLTALTAAALMFSLSGCTETTLGGHGSVGPDKTRDRGTDSKHLSQLKAGIWVDPNGCDHWIIDDGVEGYLSAASGQKRQTRLLGGGPAEHRHRPFQGRLDLGTIGDPL